MTVDVDAAPAHCDRNSAAILGELRSVQESEAKSLQLTVAPYPQTRVQ
jgi:hypothetical protein